MEKDRWAAAAALGPAVMAIMKKVRAKMEKPGMLSDNFTVSEHGYKNLNNKSKKNAKKRNGRPSSRP